MQVVAGHRLRKWDMAVPTSARKTRLFRAGWSASAQQWFVAARRRDEAVAHTRLQMQCRSAGALVLILRHSMAKCRQKHVLLQGRSSHLATDLVAGEEVEVVLDAI